MKKILISSLLAALCAGGAHAMPKNVAAVNGKKISGTELTKKLWWQHAAKGLSELIDEHLLLAEAKRLKVKADSKEVTARFDTLAANYKDKETFRTNLKSVGWSEKDLKELLKNQLVIRATVIKAKDLAVTDDDARKFFDANKERLGTPEAARLSQIFVATKAEADDAYELLSTVGADFNKLSGLKSSDANLRQNSGKLGFIARGMLLPEIEKQVFALKPGQYTKPMQTGTGFSIFKLDAIRPRQEAKFEDVKDNLKTAILNQAITQQLPELVAELRQKAKIEILK